MKITKAAEIFFSYHRNHSKKKYRQSLWNHSFQILPGFWRKRAKRSFSGWNSQILKWNHRGQKAANQTNTICSHDRFFQFHNKQHRPGLSESLQQQCAEKDVQGKHDYPLGHPWKRNRWWDHFQNQQSQKPSDARTDGAWRDASWWGPET